MERGNPLERLKMMLSDNTGLEAAAIDPRLPLLRGGLELDSLTAAAFLAAVESEFGVNILEEDLTLSSMESLEAMVSFIQSSKEQKARQ